MGNCLIDWIGIRGCDAPDVFSDVYINQLPGINLESIEKVADDEQVTYLGVWNDIQARGVKKFYNRVQTELSKKYLLKTLKSTFDLGTIIDTTQTTSPTDQYRGFVYEMKLKNQYRKSNFQVLSVQKLKIYLLSAGSVDFKIFDLDTGDVLWSKTSVLIQGWNTIQVNEVFASQRIFFGYDDANTITSPLLQINDSNADWLNSMLHSFYGFGCCDASLNGAVTTDKTQIGVSEVDYTTGSNTFGLSAVFSLGCTFDFLICNNKELLTTALWYLLGSEMMLEVLYSNRLNRYTTVDKEKAQSLFTYFEGEFEKELSIVLDGININPSDSCIECNQQIEIMTAIL